MKRALILAGLLVFAAGCIGADSASAASWYNKGYKKCYKQGKKDGYFGDDFLSRFNRKFCKSAPTWKKCEDCKEGAKDGYKEGYSQAAY